MSPRKAPGVSGRPSTVSQTIPIPATARRRKAGKVGDYRIVYEVDDNARTVTVTAVGHRRDVYRRG